MVSSYLQRYLDVFKRIGLFCFLTMPFTLIGLSLAATTPEFAEEWSNYRGANRDGISTTSIPVKVWNSEAPIQAVWKHSIGDGFSGIVVTGDQLITAFSEDNLEIIAGFNRKTGQETWRCPIGKEFVEEFGNGPRATPTLDGKQVFIYNSWGHLYAVHTETGKLNWKYEISDNLKVKMPDRGHCTSPIVIGEYVIVHAGGREENTAFIALDKNTGAVHWKTGESVLSYSSPIFASIDQSPQIIFATTRIEDVDGQPKGVPEIVALSPEGNRLWVAPSVQGVLAMPVFIPPNQVFVSSSNDIGCKLIEVKKEEKGFKTKDVWFSMEMQNHFNSSVYYKDHLYGFSNATLHCLDAKTGIRKWRKRGLGKGSLIIADQKLVILTDRGRLVLAETNPEKYVELANAFVIDGLTWTSPTLADGMLYLRSRKEIGCYDLSK